jgi:phospholipid/cholesterol/gamma-HCH transport system substrate-binding protein
MENKARYVAIGLFTLGVTLAGFLFVYWLQNVGGLGQRAVYQIRFQSPVSGLLRGSAVLFNGIRVGEVTEVALAAQDPRQVSVKIAVDPATPVRADTKVEVEFQGLTGATAIALRGGSPTAPALSAAGGAPPLLVADDASTQSLTAAAREALHRLDSILVDNAEPLKSMVGNLNTFSAALARNSDKLDGIVAGLERFTGGGVKGPLATFDLTAPRAFPPAEKVVQTQIAVPDPSAPISLDNQKVLPPYPDAPGYGNAQWADTIPKLVQAKVIQALENSNYVSAVSRPLDALTADFQLLVDIRAFRLPVKPGGAAEVELGAKMLGPGGRIFASKVFAAKAARDGGDATAAVAALDEAFGKATVELVKWVPQVVEGQAPAKR